MRIRKSSILAFFLVFCFVVYSIWAFSRAREETEKGLREISPIEDEISALNKKIAQLEDEARGNVKILSSIKDKLDVLVDVEKTNNGEKGAILSEIQSQLKSPIEQILAPAKQSNGQCAATVGYRASGSTYHVDKFYEEWDFVDRDGGVWKQGWEIKSSDAEWRDTKLEIILMPHSHNDPGWVKTLDTYYTGQTRTILKVIVDALSKNPLRKFIWAETVFLNMWFDDPTVEKDYKTRFTSLLKARVVNLKNFVELS
jgi:alpha-mannosidase II